MISSDSSSGSSVLNNADFFQESGNITLNNTAAITGKNAAGSFFGGQNFSMTGGNLIINSSQGLVTGTNSVGNLFSFGLSVNIAGGTFLNNDAVRAPSIQITNSGILAGAGTFNDPLVSQMIAINNAGTVIPGNASIGSPSPAKMEINGSYTQTADGKLIINILNPTTYSKLNILGAANTAHLNGTVQLALSPEASFSESDVFTILQTENGLGRIGEFSTYINGIANFTPIYQYLNDRVLISFNRKNIVANYTETLLSSVNITNIRLGREMVELKTRLTRSKKTIDVSSTTSFAQSEQLLAANEDPNYKHYLPSRTSTDNTQNAESGSTCKRPSPANFYIGPSGNVGQVHDIGNQPGFDYWSTGAIAGFDYAFSQLGVGTALDYNYIHGDADEFGGFHVHEALASVYGIYSPNALTGLSVNGIVGGGYDWYQIERTIGSGLVTGKPSGAQFDALLNVEYTLSKDKFKFVPLAGAQYIYLSVGKYTEQGNELKNLQASRQKVQSLRSTLGTRVQYTWTKEGRDCQPTTVKIELDGAWQREFLNKNQSIDFTSVAFAQGLNTVVVPNSGRNIFLAGIDLHATFKDKYGCEGSYDFQWNDSYRDHNFYLGFNLKF